MADNYTIAAKQSLNVKLEKMEDLKDSVSSLLLKESELNAQIAKQHMRKSIKVAFTNRLKPPNTYEK